ncbi:MAG: 50S ribosomal protein L21 [Bacteroidia bacterium]|nr:50S ribosomal protein L21 [Bacteroidia bacterium]
MYAIIEIAGQQFKIEKANKIYVHRLDAEEGASVEFDKVLLIDNQGEIKVGTPILEGAKVTAKILSHLKGDKVKVFKKKRRKGYKVLKGHRQQLTQLEIEDIFINNNGSREVCEANFSESKENQHVGE